MTNPVGYITPPLGGAGQIEISGLVGVTPPGGMPTNLPGDIGRIADSETLYGPLTLTYDCPPGTTSVDFGAPPYTDPSGAPFDITSTAFQTLAGLWHDAGINFCTLCAHLGGATASSGPNGDCPPGFYQGNISDCNWSMTGFGDLQVGSFEGIFTDLEVSRNAFGGDLWADRESAPYGSVTGVKYGIYPQIPTEDTTNPSWPHIDRFAIGWVCDGFLLRPTPLTWSGQDPDNKGNRAIWATDEVASVEIAGTCAGSNIAHGPSWFVLGIVPTWDVTGLEELTYPVALTPGPPPPPPPPLVTPGMSVGVSESGIVPLG